MITKSGVFRKNLKGIVAVHPIEVTDGDCWKVNFGLVTHICACYNGPLPKLDQYLDNRVSVIVVCSNVVDFQNFAAQTESYLHDALHSKNCQADEYGRPDEGSDPTFGVGCIAYASN